ncbi:3-oxo-5-alpha-steroid 4-dehydrogenase, partial [Ostertagia ostertagi]
MSEFQAVLLCGGSGSRMTELCDGMLKCLLPIADVPMFWYPLNTLVCSGVKGLLFTIAGFAQMTIWAKNKHRAYKKEFPDYPKERKAIVPFLI